KGHNKLADKLNTILQGNLAKVSDYRPSLKIAKESTYRVPVDRRYKLPLATHVEHEQLRHEMVLTPEVESKILRIEKEYLARERLAHHGLKRSEEHTSELQSRENLVCRLLLEKKYGFSHATRV